MLLRTLRLGSAGPLAMAVALAVTPAASAADSTPPTQPGAITVSNVTATSASLAWGKSTDDVGIVGYRVYRGPSSASDSELRWIATTDGGNSYSATKLYSGTGYKFGIVAMDAANNKSAMRTVTLTTAPSSDRTAPAAPGSGSVSPKAFSSSRIDIVWGASASSDVAGYQVFRDGSIVTTIDLPGGTRYSDNGLAAASSHSYVIKSVDSAGNVSAGTTAKSATTLATGAVRIARGPYLSNVTGTSAVISWWTNLATPGVVSWGTGSATENTRTDPAGSVHHHSVTISVLTAGTPYLYQVGNGAGVTASGSFRTAATPAQAFTFATIGDFGGGGPGATQNANTIAAAGTQFILTVGDNIYPSAGNPDPDFTTTYSDFDQRFYKPFAGAIKSQPFFPANGNKEYYGDGVFWDNFPMPGSNHSWYSFDWGAAHILVLDSEQPFAPGSEQYTFARNDLAAHQGDTWRIVVIHRPPYSSATASSSSQPVRQYLVPLFQEQDVDLVMSGNTHNYERSHPLINGAPAAGGVTYLVTGAGGNGFNAFKLAQPSWSAFREDTFYQYTRLTVSSSELKLDGIRADSGAVFDSVTMTRSSVPPPTPPEPPGNLTATPVGSSEIDLSWTASPSAGVTAYRVYRGSATGTPLATVNAPATTFRDTGLSPSTTYDYSVTAVSANGESTPATASATTGPGGGGGTTLTLVPTDDATIDATNTTLNAGTSSRLTADNSPVVHFLLKFDVPTSCSTVSSARLTLTVGSSTNNDSTRGGDFFNAPDNGWSQGTVTWATAPAASGSPIASLSTPVALNTAYTVDLSSLVTGPGIVSLRVSTTTGDAAAYFSKEGSPTAGPRLTVTC